MKTPGFLKRIFSFGRGGAKEAKDEAVEAKQKLAPVSAEPEVVKEEQAEPKPQVERPAVKIEKTPTAQKTVDSPPKQVVQPSSAADEATKSKAPASKDNRKDKKSVEPVVSTPEKPVDHHIVEKPPIVQPDAKSTDQEKKSWLTRLTRGLSRSSSQLGENIAAVFTRKKLDDDALEQLEDILLQADFGVETSMKIIDSLAKQRMGKTISDEEVRAIMAQEIEKTLSEVARPLELDLSSKPHVILVVGVNGSGKTTTIGKLAQKLKNAGYSTLLVAGDTFRAAAIEQLEIWGERTGSAVIKGPAGSDPSALAYDAWQQAKERGHDVMMMDTAGRLQNRSELMAELEKIIRVLRKKDPTAPHTVLLTLDATTGQNALNQVEVFEKVAGVNGLIMTKLDGSARGGILVSISAKFKLPVYFVGVGEQVEDLEPFEAADFARSLVGLAPQAQLPDGSEKTAR